MLLNCKCKEWLRRLCQKVSILVLVANASEYPYELIDGWYGKVSILVLVANASELGLSARIRSKEWFQSLF